MGTLVEIRTGGSTQARRPVNYDRLPLAELQQLARQSHPEHTDEACRVYVQRILDLEVERRLSIMHERPGWHSCSPGFGDGTGASTEVVDAMYLALLKGIRIGEWHNVAKRALSQLHERSRLAILLQTAKADARLDGPWCATHDHIAANLSYYARMLGWSGVQPLSPALCRDEDGAAIWEKPDMKSSPRPKWKLPGFNNGQAIKRAAHGGRVELLLLAKAGVA